MMRMMVLQYIIKEGYRKNQYLMLTEHLQKKKSTALRRYTKILKIKPLQIEPMFLIKVLKIHSGNEQID
jgi:hypothetical protein